MEEAATVTVLAELHYADPDAALVWLEAAFGFETRMVVRNPAGKLVFAETGAGGVAVAIVPEQAPRMRSPLATGGANTQTVQIRMSDGDIDAHCALARAAGAVIVQEPETFFFGDRAYLAADPEGHVWNIGRRGAGASGPPPEGWSVTFAGRS